MPVLTKIPVRKPGRQEFVRVRSGDEWRFTTAIYRDDDAGNRENYLVVPSLWPDLRDEIRPSMLLVAMSRNSPVPYLWPCVLPDTDGRPNRWHESALEAARLAETQWIRVASDLTAGCYLPFVARGDLPEPVWPELTMEDLVRLAFRDKVIDGPDHPVLRRLRGEI